MIEIIIPEQHYELFDEEKEEFLPPVDIKETRIQLEHSLISLKKWEQKHHKPFLGKTDKLSNDEFVDYIRCMTLSHGVDPKVYDWIPKEVIEEIADYIKDSMTATWFKESETVDAQKGSREIITAEIIYYWMIMLNIPIEFQKWHLNQLLTMIKVVNIKNSKQKKKDPKIAAQERAALNAKRRAECKSKG